MSSESSPYTFDCTTIFNTPEKRKELVCQPVYFDSARRSIPKWVIQTLNLSPHEDFLDLGCGVLRIGLPIISYLDSGRYYGYDLCANRIEEAKKEVDEYKLNHKKPILTEDWERITYNSRQFKHIWCYQVLIHIPDESLHFTIRRIKNVLKPDGLALVSVNTNVDEYPTDGTWCEYPFVCRRLDFYEEAFEKTDLKIEQIEEWNPDSGEKLLKVSHSKKIEA